MRFTQAIDLYVQDMTVQGRLNSDRSRDTYRSCLSRFADGVGNRDPRTIGREDVKRHLAHFEHPNTQRRQRSMLVSFFDWAMEEGHRPDNPARQTRAPKQRKARVHRLTLDETVRFLQTAQGTRERRVAYLGVCAGLRREEIRLLQGKHLARAGWVWVSADIAKGGRERWVPVLPELKPIIEQACDTVGLEHYVLPAEQFADPPRNTRRRSYPERAGDGKTIWRITQRIGKRAGIPVPVNPHMMRHAFADHIARGAGVLVAQRMLGHADLSTTQQYLSEPTLDDIAKAVHGLSVDPSGYPPGDRPVKVAMETVGIEPTSAAGVEKRLRA
jgi:integrase/recombinase XerD